MAVKKHPERYTYTGTLSDEEQSRRKKNSYIRKNDNRHLETQKPAWGLQLWPDNVSGIPSEITRSALFCLPRRGHRRIRDNELVYSSSEAKLHYFGAELDQHDLCLWMVLLKAAQGQSDDFVIRTRMSHLLRALGRNDAGNNRKWLEGSIQRLAQGSFFLECKRDGLDVDFLFNFLEGVAVDKITKEVHIKLGLGKKILFGYTSFVDIDEHLALRSQMSMAIHKYAVGQPRGQRHGIPIDRLKLILGYQGEMRNFKRALLKGLEELQEQGLLSAAIIDSDGIVRWTLNHLKRVRT